MTKKPSYRFEGYTESWEEKKFGQLIRSIQTGTTLLGNEQNNGIPLLKMGNIQRGYWDLAKIERLEQEIESENIIRYGDFIFNTRNTLELVGKGATWVLKNGIYGFNSNLARVIFDGVDTIFFNYLYNIPNSISQVKARAVGTTSVAAVYPRDLYSINFSLPSLPEQTAIGSFFQDIDQLISLQQRKLEVLKEQKKTYLKLLFPAKGQTKPALRFAGFEDEWKEVKLGEIGVTKSGVGFPDSEQGGVKGIPFYKVSDMNNIGNEIEMVTSNNYVTQEQIDSRKWKVIDTVPAIMFAKVGAALLLNRKRLIREPFLIDNNTMVYIPSVYWDVMFCKILFDTLNLSKYSQVGALPSYNGSDIEAIQVSIPTLPEQEAIGSFFQELDKAIGKQEEKVNQLKESKQTLLRKMFI